MLHDLGLTLFVKHVSCTHTLTDRKKIYYFTHTHTQYDLVSMDALGRLAMRVRVYRSDEIAKQVQGRVYLAQSKREIALFALHAH